MSRRSGISSRGISGSIIALGILMRLIHINDVRQRTPDEYVYTAMAQRVAVNGPAEFPRLFSTYNATPELWIFPPPSRVSYVATLAAWMRLVQQATIEAGVWLSFTCSVGSLALMAWIGRRFFTVSGDGDRSKATGIVASRNDGGRWLARSREIRSLPDHMGLVALFVQATNPFEVLIARRAWADSLVGLVGMALLWLALEIRRNPDRWWPFIASAAVGAYGVGVKELLAVAWGVCGISVLWWMKRRCLYWWENTAMLAVASVGALALFAQLILAASGGISPFVEAWRHMSSAVESNSYAWDYQNVVWWQYVGGIVATWPMALLIALDSRLRVVPIRRKA